MQSANDYQAIYDYLRAKYYIASSVSWDSAALIALRDTTFTSASKEVTIISTSSEAGGTATAQLKFNKMVLLQAINDLLRAECPAALPPEDAPEGSLTNFGYRPVTF